MPTPRTHGGAALARIPLNVPGFMGLNTQQASGTLGPEWCTVLQNAVIDDNGRIAARKGFEDLIGTTTQRWYDLIELVESDGGLTLMAMTSDGYRYSTNNGQSWNGTTTYLTIDDPLRSSIVNFNNKAWIFTYKTTGTKGVYWDPNTPAADVAISGTNVPDSGNVVAAFGRLWGVMNDGHTIRYSALLDGTDWDGAGSGLVDMWNVWPGNDQIQAIATFNGALVVFGKRSIIMWTDGAGSQIGIDPLTMYVVDVIQGTGCISRHSIQHVDGDLWFLSEYGLQSLGRLIQEKSNPINNLSKNVQDYFNAAVSAANLSLLRSVYSPRDKVYLLSLPSGGTTESGRCFVFDTRGKLEDGAVRCLGTWTLVPTAMVYTRAGNFFIGRNDSKPFGRYAGQLDAAESYIFDYESGWLDLTQQGFLIFPKRISGVFYSDTAFQATFKWALDFEQVYTTRTKVFTAPSQSGSGEWGASEWNLAEFGGGVNLQSGQLPASGSGEYIKIGITVVINNSVLAVQQLELFAKVGRYA
jgi:hypothetical protein